MTISSMAVPWWVWASVLVGVVTGGARAADWVTLSPANHAAIATDSRTVQAVWGDYALRNDRIVATIADPERISGRSASRWGVAHVGGAVIGLARRDGLRDLLTAYYPAPLRYRSVAPDQAAHFRDDTQVAGLTGREGAAGQTVTLELPAYELENGRLIKDLEKQPPQVRGAPRPYAEVRYTLADGWDWLRVEVNYVNPTEHPFEVDPEAVLRVDGTFDEVATDFDGRLVTVWNAWQNIAYGVLAADDHRLATAGRRHNGHRLARETAQGRVLSVPPGGAVRVVRDLIPGGDLFHVRAVAADRLGEPTVPVRLALTAPDGPVADALVTARTGGRIVGAGRSDTAGILTFRMPAGRLTLEIAPFGRPHRTIELDPAEARATHEIVFEAAGGVSGRVTDARDEPIPCKLVFLGREGTPDPFFFPDSGVDRVRNIGYARDGQFRQILPPGRYRVVITYGPFYDAAVRDIEIVPGRLIDIRERLTQQVSSDGWISADLHNHSAISGFSEQFFVYPYTKCPSVDGDSVASPLGRVLNLVCEQIQFAVPTEHNFIASYTPFLEQLGLAGRLTTVPGIGYTAGRRHTITHQNVFPMVHVPGREDGGAPQRPQHVNQLTFMAGWYGESEKLVQVAFPRADPARIQRGMHALDVQALEPIVEGQPISGIDNRILEWIELLNRGYRIPGTVGGGGFNNALGSGARRLYLPVKKADDPAAIDPIEVVRAVKQGRGIMSTGPLLEAAVSAAAAEARPGDTLRAADGRVETRIRVQCADWISIDRVQILLNGERRPDLDFRRTTHPDRFSEGVVPFEQRVPLKLERDTHVIVVASGESPPEFARLTAAGESRVQVAVSNPIYVDVAEPGFRPHSPLDDAVASSLEFVIPLLAQPGAEPGRVRLTLTNASDTEADDSVALRIVPPEAARVVGSVEQTYRIAPGGRATLDWDLVFNDDYLAKRFPISSTYHNADSFAVRISRSGVFPGRRGAARHMAVDIPLRALPPIAVAGQVAAKLADQPTYPLTARGAQPWAWTRYAVAGDHLAVAAEIRDAHPMRHTVITEGACLEVFAAMDGRDAANPVPGGHYPVRQVYLLPAVGEVPAAAFASSQLDPTVVPAAEVAVHSEPMAGGYRLQALIPLALLGLDVDGLPAELHFGGMMTPVRLLGVPPMAGRFLLESRVTARAPDGRVRRASVFNAAMPFQYHYQFGRMRLQGAVRIDADVLTPLSAGADAPPARVHLNLRNISDAPVAGDLTVQATPADAVRWLAPPTVAYRLAPGEAMDHELTIGLTPEVRVNRIEVTAPRTPNGEIIATALATLEVMDRPLDRFAPLDTPEAAQPLLTKTASYRIRIGGEAMADIRFAVAGSDLAVSASVTDRHVRVDPVPWRGSCLEVFGAQPGRDGIGQVFLTPASGETPARAFRGVRGRIEPSPDIRVQTVPADDGYRLLALIPLQRLALDPDAERLQLEFQLTTSVMRGGPFVRGTMFGSPRAYQDAVQYGVFRARQDAH